jgi:hypothetical protein
MGVVCPEQEAQALAASFCRRNGAFYSGCNYPNASCDVKCRFLLCHLLFLLYLSKNYRQAVDILEKYQKKSLDKVFFKG